MVVDNFSSIKRLLVFPSPKHFYFIQIMQRKKDFPEHTQNVDVKVLKSMYIYSTKEFDAREEEIKDMCRKMHARAYIWLNRRNCKDIALFAIQELARYVSDDNINRAYRVWDHCVGKLPASGEKFWVIDLDTKDDAVLMDLTKTINYCDSSFEPIIVNKLPTKNGYHIITHPFNIRQFSDLDNKAMISSSDIKKDSPTLLYYYDSQN